MALSATLRSIFSEALQQSSLQRELGVQVTREGNRLTIGELHYDLASFGKVAIVAIGKASAAMCDYFAAMLPQATGVAVGPQAPASAKMRYFQGGHPLPNQSSLDAAHAVTELLCGLDRQSLVLFLISGGGSALFEMPLNEGVTLDDMREFHQALIHSGLSIVEMNVLRKHASAVKGGRLAVAAGAATQCTVLVSDVPGNVEHIISSGLSLPDPSTVEDCHRILRAHPLPWGKVVRLLARDACPETPKPDDAAFRTARWLTMLSNERLVEHAAAAAKALGYYVVIDNSCDDWEYGLAAEYLLGRLRVLAQEYPRVCLLSGGEVLVRVTGEAGVGGRNQHFALECALRLDKYFAEDQVAVLSAGSDGIDGNSPAAGAVVDMSTVLRARAAGIDPAASLEAFDSGSLFATLGDAIVTGPTNNNLRDLRILIHERTS